ncbi:MAG: hypothetical protein FIA95_16735, partial [Gemmatimonadetes bacterium]|nr:hypothetical protein [Gemmatimonadota bacterium]
MTAVFRALALRGAASIAERRTVTTLGIRYPGKDTAGLEGVYDYTLYEGAAGVGLVSLDLAAATGDARWLALAGAVGDGLLESTPSEGDLPSGLYTGFEGVVLFHLARARLFHDGEALDRAISLASRLGTRPPESPELLAGAAGTGLLQLAVHRATGNDVFLGGARRAFAFLEDTALRDGRSVAWEPGVPDKSLQPGLAHGVAGPCLFLAELAAQTRDRKACRLRDAAFRWLDAHAIPTSGDGLTWPKDITSRAHQHHWCHGSVGVGQAYLTLHRCTGGARALRVAEAAARAAWQHARRRSGEPTHHCHGTAGAIELFLDLHESGAGGRWQARAEALARRHVVSGGGASRGRGGRRALTLGGEGAGLMLGTAGVVRQLMRLAELPVTSVIPWTGGRVRVRRTPLPRKRPPARRRPTPLPTAMVPG